MEHRKDCPMHPDYFVEEGFSNKPIQTIINPDKLICLCSELSIEEAEYKYGDT